MPRDGAGVYSLPGGVNPVISGTTIDTIWANPTLDDIAVALTDSLSRTGSGGMLVPFLNADGAIGSPGIAWVNEPTMGIYREAAAEMRVSMLGVDRTRWVDNVDPLGIWIVSDASWRAVTNVFNPYTIIGDWTWEGRVVTDDSTTTRAGFNIPLGVEPTVPVDGDMWLEASNLFARVGGATVGLGGSNIVPASFVLNSVLRGDGASGWAEVFDLLINDDGDLVTEGTIGVSDGVNQIFFENTGPDCIVARSGGAGAIQFNISAKMGAFYLGDRTNAAADISAYSQIWSQNDSPNRLVFTNDIGDDVVIGLAGGSIAGNVSVNSSHDFNGTDNRADNFISLINDGGNDTITLEDSGSVVNWPLYSTINIVHPGGGNLTITEGSGTTLFNIDGTDTIGGVVISEGAVSIMRYHALSYVIWGSGIT